MPAIDAAFLFTAGVLKNPFRTPAHSFDVSGVVRNVFSRSMQVVAVNKSGKFTIVYESGTLARAPAPNVITSLLAYLLG